MLRQFDRQVVHTPPLVPQQSAAVGSGQTYPLARVAHGGHRGAVARGESIGPPTDPATLPSMLRLAPTLVLLALLPVASAESVMAIGYGVQHRYDEDTRELTQSGSFQALDGGHHILLGFSAPERGFVGYPWLDLEWSRNSQRGTRLDTLGVTYVERVPLWKLWLGGGLGSAYHDVRINTGSGLRRDTSWNFAAKAVVGLDLFNPVYVEAGYIYAGKAAGESMDYVFIDLGLRF